MKFNKNDIKFFLGKKLEIEQERPSLAFLNKTLSAFIMKVPWQNIDMIRYHYKQPPSWKEIKERVFNGRGGICLELNEFFYHLLKSLDFNAIRILCNRNQKGKTHLALCVLIDQIHYFVDVGDVQPYEAAISLAKSNQNGKQKSLSYQIRKEKETYELVIRKLGAWTTSYQFELDEVTQEALTEFVEQYYSAIFKGSLWKNIHLAYFPNGKLIALKDQSFILEKKIGLVERMSTSSSQQFVELFEQNIDLPFSSKEVIEANSHLEKLQMQERFAIQLSEQELHQFLTEISNTSVEHSLKFVKHFAVNVLVKLPFNNLQMLERGFGIVPTARDMKADMLKLLGGTCATMNVFLGAVLYKLGFDVCLISGTMQQKNDHIALMLFIKDQSYVLDYGDGQPYFNPLSTTNNQLYEHPFRTYRSTVITSSDIQIDFLIDQKWQRDVTYHLEPKVFSLFQATLDNHYTQANYGPFWKGLRFSIYPRKKIRAIRDHTFIYQNDDDKIIKQKFSSSEELQAITNQYMPAFSEKICKIYQKLKAL